MVLYMRKYGTGEEEVGGEKQEIKEIVWGVEGERGREGNLSDY